MPETRPYIDLIRLYFIDEQVRYPWCLPLWQDLTGIKGGDLFGGAAGWSTEVEREIKVFFDEYRARDSEEERAMFARGGKGGADSEGRKFFSDWVGRMWERRWKLHTAFIEFFVEDNVHPLAIMKAANDLTMWPGSEMYVPQSHETAALALFGPEVFNDGILIRDFRFALNLFATWTWGKLRRTIKTDLGKMEKKHSEAFSAFEALIQTKPATTSQVAKVITSVGEWRKLTLIYSDSTTVQKANEMMDEVNCIMVEIAGEKAPSKAKAKAKGSGKRLTTFKKNPNNFIASEEGLSWIIGLYHQYFGREDDDHDGGARLLDKGTLAIRLEDVDAEQGDLGTELEAKMSYDLLSQRLGFRHHHLPHQFNQYRDDKGTQNAWDARDRDLFKKPSPDWVPNSLHWHQLRVTRI
ncbi:hypothetical protein K435DRAFT_798322 [Dendrothele bispora CBS 962.96]|uniref:Uncharacterized protein n=1 Tax=Dendrothele bispora (strain CBS 962.96) TaxID=1314807 RepID=A0A4S8M0N5_DENBC|nr:hypothetical protein K435DRAFT_798322 [Dendrothele bispora CBS 962.96]